MGLFGEKMTVEQRRNEPNDQFPVGMRVLAVDDDPICLRLLETLLRKCQYHGMIFFYNKLGIFYLLIFFIFINSYGCL